VDRFCAWGKPPPGQVRGDVACLERGRGKTGPGRDAQTRTATGLQRPDNPPRFRDQVAGKEPRVVIAASTVAIVAVAAVVIVALIVLMYIVPRGGRRRRPKL
jgi:hypothetical protein